MKLTKDNVIECWNLFEQMDFGDLALNFSDFEDWVYNNLYECPACSKVIMEEEYIYEPQNYDGVCQDCINDGYYDQE